MVGNASLAAGLVVAAVAVGLPALVAYEVAKLEKPKHVLLRKLGKEGTAELRRYSPSTVAEVEVPADEAAGLQKAMNKGFRSVAGFIFGGNASKEKVAMTSPVVVDVDSKLVRVSFVLPSKARVLPIRHSLSSLPAPSDPRVALRSLPAYTAATVSYRAGVADEKAMRRAEATLRAALAAEGLAPLGPLVLLEYSPPWQLPFLRPVEVMLRLPEGTQ